jgi:hypothetical protein
LISTDVQNIVIADKPGQKTAMVKGYIVARLGCMFVKVDDIIQAIRRYLEQRPSEKVKLVNIDKNSIVFFNEIKEEENDVFIIPTQANVVQGYDFTKDINGVIDSIKNRILGIETSAAKDIILSYPEIASVNIRVTPPRYNTIPRLKSRILIKYPEGE